MTNSELRTIALAVKSRFEEIHETVSPAASEVSTWILNADDSSLPTIGEVKAVLLAFEAFEKPSLLLYNEVRALKSLPDEAATLPDPDEGHSHVVTWNDVVSKPLAFPPATHTHEGLGGGASAWADITDKPETFPPSAHGHYFEEMLDGLPGHYHSMYDIDDDSKNEFSNSMLGNHLSTSIQLLPVGAITNYLNAVYQLCNGTAILRTGTPGGRNLVSLGCPFGAGNGTSTVNLPNLTSPLAGLAYYMFVGATI